MCDLHLDTLVLGIDHALVLIAFRRHTNPRTDNCHGIDFFLGKRITSVVVLVKRSKVRDKKVYIHK